MNKFVAFGIMALGLIFGSTAMAADNSGAGFVASAKIDQTHWRVQSTRTKDELGYNLGFGYRWHLGDSKIQSLGVEGGYADLGTASLAHVTSARGQLATVGATYHVAFGQTSPWFFEGRAGYARSFTDVREHFEGLKDHGQHHGDGFYYGGELGYNVTHDLAVTAGYDVYHLDQILAGRTHATLGVATLGVQYRF